MNNKTTSGGGITFVSLLQLVFIVLKLCNVITWKWVFVLMPLIVATGITIILFVVLAILMLVEGK